VTARQAGEELHAGQHQVVVPRLLLLDGADELSQLLRPRVEAGLAGQQEEHVQPDGLDVVGLLLLYPARGLEGLVPVGRHHQRSGLLHEGGQVPRPGDDHLVQEVQRRLPLPLPLEDLGLAH